MSLDKIRIALETALDDMPIIPPATIVTSVDGLFTTDLPHNLVTGLIVKIVNHTDKNGTFKVEVFSDTTFVALDLVSDLQVESDGTDGTVTAQLNAWEDSGFIPVTNVPFQEVWLMPAFPQNPTYGNDYYLEVGYLQINLYYPKDRGSHDVVQRAELIRTNFKRGSSFTEDDITVIISRTPSIEKNPVEEYACRIVKIPYWADVFQ